MNKSKIQKLTSDYHEELIASLKNKREANLYLKIAMEEYEQDRDTAVLLVALRNIAEARGGLGQLSKNTHLNRQSLYQVLSKNGNPTLDTFDVILNALGYRLTITPQIMKKAG